MSKNNEIKDKKIKVALYKSVADNIQAELSEIEAKEILLINNQSTLLARMMTMRGILRRKSMTSDVRRIESQVGTLELSLLERIPKKEEINKVLINSINIILLY